VPDKGEGKSFVLPFKPATKSWKRFRTGGKQVKPWEYHTNSRHVKRHKYYGVFKELAQMALHLLRQEPLPGGTIPCPHTAQKDHWERKESNSLTPEASQSEARAELAPNARLVVGQLHWAWGGRILTVFAEEAVPWQEERRVTLPKGNPRRNQATGDGRVSGRHPTSRRLGEPRRLRASVET